MCCWFPQWGFVKNRSHAKSLERNGEPAYYRNCPFIGDESWVLHAALALSPRGRHIVRTGTPAPTQAKSDQPRTDYINVWVERSRNSTLEPTKRKRYGKGRNSRSSIATFNRIPYHWQISTFNGIPYHWPISLTLMMRIVARLIRKGWLGNYFHPSYSPIRLLPGWSLKNNLSVRLFTERDNAIQIPPVKAGFIQKWWDR